MRVKECKSCPDFLKMAYQLIGTGWHLQTGLLNIITFGMKIFILSVLNWVIYIALGTFSFNLCDTDRQVNLLIYHNIWNENIQSIHFKLSYTEQWEHSVSILVVQIGRFRRWKYLPTAPLPLLHRENLCRDIRNSLEKRKTILWQK